MAKTNETFSGPGYSLMVLQAQLDSGKMVVSPLGREGVVFKSVDSGWLWYAAQPPYSETSWHRTLAGAVFALPQKKS